MTSILKQALAHETQGAAIYSQAAEITTHDESRMLFLELAQMEEGHAKQLIDRAAKAGADVDCDELKQFVDAEEEKPAPPQMLQEIANGDMRGVLNVALRFEQEAVQNYRTLLEMAQSNEMKILCQELVQEEEDHVKQIERTLLSLDWGIEERPDL
ncbi:putative rubrerythrin [Magnetofaba australis IT-1]|uniref:Putative rubrerythrin n=1 Tax=Magnetofaba australis IT-1 TaxID=1434232 RepID=A0A1Y2K825_9PROT|nr:putative rubrerythrin [Magnetofaba australis IT-1]